MNKLVIFDELHDNNAKRGANTMKTEMIARIKKNNKIKAACAVCICVIVLVVVWQLTVVYVERNTDINGESVFITKIDYRHGGFTRYYSYKPWITYHEDVFVSRPFGTTKAIGVGQDKKVRRIHCFPKHKEDYILYYEQDGTVRVSYDMQSRETTGHALEEFIEDFQWAEEQVSKARKRCAHLIPQNFKDALGIK